MEGKKKLIVIIAVILSLTILIGIMVVMTNLKKIAPFGLFTVNVQDNTENNISLEGGGSNGSTNNNSGTADNNSGDNSGSNAEQQSTNHILEVGNYGIIEDASFTQYHCGRKSDGSSIGEDTLGIINLTCDVEDLPSGSFYCLVLKERLSAQPYALNVGEVLNDIDPILGLNCLYSWAGPVDPSNDGIEGDIQYLWIPESEYYPDIDFKNDYFIFVVGHFEDIDHLRDFVVDGYSIGVYMDATETNNLYASTFPFD